MLTAIPVPYSNIMTRATREKIIIRLSKIILQVNKRIISKEKMKLLLHPSIVKLYSFMSSDLQSIKPKSNHFCEDKKPEQSHRTQLNKGSPKNIKWQWKSSHRNFNFSPDFPHFLSYQTYNQSFAWEWERKSSHLCQKQSITNSNFSHLCHKFLSH